MGIRWDCEKSETDTDCEVLDEMKSIRVGRKTVPLEKASIGQLQIAALKAFPSSPYQKEIRAEIDKRHARGERQWVPNPSQSELADIGYEQFHGKPSMKITTDDLDWPPPEELEDQFGPFGELPGDLACLGELLAVMYEDERSLEDEVVEFSRPYPFLATDWKRQGKETLYIVGGDYEVEVWDDFICGPLIWVLYSTIKSFEDFEPTDFKHRFVEGPSLPTLAHNYDGNQLYIFRGDSNFSIDRSRPTSLGIDG